MKKTLTALALALTAVFGLAACSAPAAEPTIAVTAETVIVDVRTSDEYNAGHLEGAVNIDVQAPDFDSRMAELPTDGEYVVYCASGNRSAAATARMEGLGFTGVTDAGGMSEASGATGLEIVTAP